MTAVGFFYSLKIKPSPHILHVLPPCGRGAYCQCVLNSPDAKMGAKPQPTLRHDSLQADDVGMIKLRHDGCFSQEVPLLLLRVAHLQGLQGHRDVSLPRQPHASVANLSEFT